MDDDESAQARRTIADNMIDKLVDRLPGHTRTQRLALLREAFSEVRHRSFAHSPRRSLAVHSRFIQKCSPATFRSIGSARWPRHIRRRSPCHSRASPPERSANVELPRGELALGECLPGAIFLLGRPQGLGRTLSHALGALDLIQVAHRHGGDQGETDGDGGGQTVTAMVEPVAI
jgi:hypothetical protein